MARFFTCLLILTGLSGCATTGSVKKHEANLQSWVGSSSDQLIASWGLPIQTMDMGSGKKSFIYYRGPGVREHVLRAYPPGVIKLDDSTVCTTEFLVGITGVVEGWRHKGNCKA